MNTEPQKSDIDPLTRPEVALRRPYALTRQAAGLLFISGQVGLDPETQQLVPGGFPAEFGQMMTNLQRILTEHQLTLRDLVSVNVYLTAPDDYTRLNELYLAAFDDALPTRTTVVVRALPLGATVEIQSVAALTGA
ncbi:RidA family protein [Deinococcus peraridilitoris]|uniref:Putative translation initiation inhibitor, yjgF family n=1 Tax=Deinococcus peraridilitoris (strain DSM 19664 / LMG 22246 / CIP 109416 / KR-200) TaxID=937777 RepID=L0A862_DEIPD|nr:RidA family protein [Deinococcus peraridilitoris]AFZ69594.1 putative translation initiation inhibitor, yjgF family [Deinococcus peraridilitoris DSM 19664]